MFTHKKHIGFAFAITLAFTHQSWAQTIEINSSRERGGSGYHVAQSGDTLYDLAHIYYGDAMLWPRLWAYNPQITNPHWIYPGDIVFLRAPSSETISQYTHLNGMYYPLGGFFTSSEIETAGTLRYARTSRRLLAEYDTVYLELNERENVQIGDEFTINRVDDIFYDFDNDDDDDDAVTALKYRVTGRVRITGFSEETELVTAEITELWDVLERGDTLFLNSPQLIVVQNRENTVDLEGVIVDQLDNITHFHEQSYVFIDLGFEDGVRVGNRFFVWDRQDEGAEIMAIRNSEIDYQLDVIPELPWQLYGEALVIYASEHYATAIISNAGNHELTDGMRVTLQRGY